MGAGFFVQKTMQSTVSGESGIRLNWRGLCGFGTRTKPSARRFRNHAE